jgi:shikimate kinase/3-dehydroquinate synthase
MSLNTESEPFNWSGKSIVLVGLMGAGKTAIGKRIAIQLNLPFYDADHEIEKAAGRSVAEIFKQHGEAYFRMGEKRVIRRLLDEGPIVLAPGGGAFMDPETRSLIHERAISIWLRCPLPVLLRRVTGRPTRPLLNAGNPAEILSALSISRGPFYAQADIIVDGSEDPPHVTTQNVLTALASYVPPRQIKVSLTGSAYDILIGDKLLERAGRFLAPLIPQPRCIVITDTTVAGLHLKKLQNALAETGISDDTVMVEPGEASKSVATWSATVDCLLTKKVDRSTTIIALGGGVVGDLAGFAAATTLRGLPFVQIPTTLLAQVDSSVGGKTGINTPHGKNLVGAFYQPNLVLADTSVLITLPKRELLAGYAEIVKAGLIGDASFYDWCESHAERMLEGDSSLLTEAIAQSVSFKARIVGDDERETKKNDGRALLNFGHTFGHALEAETGYGAGLLHGEAVAIGLLLATELSAALGLCPQEDPGRIALHLQSLGLPTKIAGLSAERLISRMQQDKKMRDGKLTFVLTRGIGRAFTSDDVPASAVQKVLLSAGAV